MTAALEAVHGKLAAPVDHARKLAAPVAMRAPPMTTPDIKLGIDRRMTYPATPNRATIPPNGNVRQKSCDGTHIPCMSCARKISPLSSDAALETTRARVSLPTFDAAVDGDDENALDEFGLIASIDRTAARPRRALGSVERAWKLECARERTPKIERVIIHRTRVGPRREVTSVPESELALCTQDVCVLIQIQIPSSSTLLTRHL